MESVDVMKVTVELQWQYTVELQPSTKLREATAIGIRIFDLAGTAKEYGLLFQQQFMIGGSIGSGDCMRRFVHSVVDIET